MSYTLKNIKFNPFGNDSNCVITSDYGMRTLKINGKTKTSMHNGIDMITGNNIYPIADGKVVACRNTIKGYSESYQSGNYVTIDHGNGIKTIYCHLKYGTLKVKKGDIVTKDVLLGEKGSTGYSTGPHLHFGVAVNGSYVDPKPYLLGEKDLTSNKINLPILPSRGYFYFNIKTPKVIYDIGENVEYLQNLLNKVINTNLNVDGKLGELTYKAIIKFQEFYNLKKVDGFFGKECLNKAKELI